MKSRGIYDDEQVVIRSRVHPMVFAPALFWGLVTLYVMKFDSVLALFSYISAVFACYYGLCALHRLLTTTYCLTNKRFIIKKGLVGRQDSSIFLKQIHGVSIMQSPVGRLFRYGQLVFLAHMDCPVLSLSYMANPQRVESKLYEQLNQAAPSSPPEETLSEQTLECA